MGHIWKLCWLTDDLEGYYCQRCGDETVDIEDADPICDEDIESPYCPVCGACGEDGCCPPWRCQHGKGCPYPQYENGWYVRFRRTLYKLEKKLKKLSRLDQKEPKMEMFFNSVERYRLERLHMLFAVVDRFVLSGCGDGEGFIISSKYKELADLYEKYEKAEFKYRFQGDGYVGFSEGEQGQESILFIENRSHLSPWFWQSQIIVEINE